MSLSPKDAAAPSESAGRSHPPSELALTQRPRVLEAVCKVNQPQSEPSCEWAGVNGEWEHSEDVKEHGRGLKSRAADESSRPLRLGVVPGDGLLQLGRWGHAPSHTPNLKPALPTSKFA